MFPRLWVADADHLEHCITPRKDNTSPYFLLKNYKLAERCDDLSARPVKTKEKIHSQRSSLLG